MNYAVVSGKIIKDIDTDFNLKTKICRFTIKNMYYNVDKCLREPTYIRCICYGSLAEYCANELWEGLEVLVVGRILHRRYDVDGKVIDIVYIGCNTVTKIEQGEYE